MPPNTDAAPTWTPKPMRLSEFAARVGRAKATITEASRKALAPAMMAGRLDVANPVVTAWLEQRGLPTATLSGPAPSQRAKASTKVAARAPAPEGAAPEREPFHASRALVAPPDIDELADMTVSDVAARFGSMVGMIDFVEACKKLEETRKLRMANGVRSGELIEREFVASHVFGLIDGAWRRVVIDCPRTLAARIGAAARGGASNEEMIAMIRDVLSSTLEHVKHTAERRLKARPAAKRKDGADDDDEEPREPAA